MGDTVEHSAEEGEQRDERAEQEEAQEMDRLPASVYRGVEAQGQLRADVVRPKVKAPPKPEETAVPSPSTPAAPAPSEAPAEEKPEEEGTLWTSIKDWFGGTKGWIKDWSSDIETHYTEEAKDKKGFDKVTAFLGTVGFGISHFFEKLFDGSEKENPEAAPSTPAKPSVLRRVSDKVRGYGEDIGRLLQEFDVPSVGDRGKDFFNVSVPLAKEVEAAYGIPYQVVVAQACLESGNGKSGLTQRALNCFGMKGKGEDTVTVSSKEYENGQYVSRDSSFKVYNSLRDSFMDYGHRLATSKRYRPAFEHKDDPEAFLKALVEAGYATTPAPEYVRRAEARLRQFGMSLS